MQALINNLIKKIAFFYQYCFLPYAEHFLMEVHRLYLHQGKTHKYTIFFGFFLPTVYFIYNKTFFLCCVCIYYKISIELNAKVYFLLPYTGMHSFYWPGKYIKVAICLLDLCIHLLWLRKWKANVKPVLHNVGNCWKELFNCNLKQCCLDVVVILVHWQL